jgi:hypothetical protein
MFAVTAHNLLRIWFGFVVLAAVTTENGIFCDVMSYNPIETHERLAETDCFLLQICRKRGQTNRINIKMKAKVK